MKELIHMGHENDLIALKEACKYYYELVRPPYKKKSMLYIYKAA